MNKNAHGGDIYTYAKERAISASDVIDLSSNINPLSIKLDFDTLDVKAYPDIRYDRLRKELSKKYGVKKREIALFSGASAAIFSLIRGARKDVTLFAPLYGEYKRACELFDKKIRLINRFEEPYEDIVAKSTVIFVNPSTPDGKYEDMRALLELCMKKRCELIVDESFLEFTEKKSATVFLKEFDDLKIVKSLTKFYSCAGVRVGAVISSKRHISKLMKNEPSWMISTFDQRYILQALKDEDFVKRTHKFFKKERKRVFKLLKRSPLIERVYKSDVNFFLIKLKYPYNAKKLQSLCDKENILVRDCGNFDFLDDSYVRIAVKGEKETKALKRVLLA